MASEKYAIRPLKDIGKLSSDGVLAYDVEADEMLYCNKALGNILDQPVDRLMEGGLPSIIASLKDERKFLVRLFDSLMEDFRVTNVELRVNSEDDKYISVDAYWIAEQKVVIAFVKDTTKSRKHEDYIVEFGARKDTLLDGIAHDLSDPLNLINNLLDSIDRASEAFRYKRVEQPARMIREKTQLCIDLINSLLREEHIASPGVPLGSNRFDALAKITSVVTRYAELNPTKEMKIVSSRKEWFVTGDDVKFFQIVNNLVSNAVKFTEDAGKITVGIKQEEASLIVTVKDNGIGIPDYLQPYIFNKNSRAARPGLRGEKSIGLGLYIIRKLAGLMGGKIDFESVEGKGSTFTLTVPIEKKISK